MKNIAGALIRRERLLRNYSQEGLCRGICSYRIYLKLKIIRRILEKIFSGCFLNAWV